jgi:NAD+ synthase (glutamine-hydrolysing)
MTMNYGFVRVGAAIPPVKVADCAYNATQMLPIINEAAEKGVEILVFPELGITSCSCGDLFRQKRLINGAEKAIETICLHSRQCETVIIIGAPVAVGSTLLNCSIVIWRGNIMGIVPQYNTPITGEAATQRWFTAGKTLPDNCYVSICGKKAEISNQKIFSTPHCTFAIETEADLLSATPHSSALSAAGAEIILCQAASCEAAEKYNYIKNQCCAQSGRTIGGYIYTSCGYGESSGDAVFAGNSFIVENGTILQQSERFSMKSRLTICEIDVEKIRHDRINSNMQTRATEAIFIPQQAKRFTKLIRKYNQLPFIPEDINLEERCNEIFNIQAMGLAKRIEHTHAGTCVIGISGGLDSTLALLVTAKAFDLLGKSHKDIIAITMPGFGTTDRTYNNALTLMQSLDVTIREISIKEACIQHFKDIEHDIEKHDVTYENSQARERTQILMDVANKQNGLVVGTGDLSELALGWATYNGDHMSMYGVNASVPKTLIKYLVRWIANNSSEATTRDTLLDIIDTPISPELIPADNNGNIKQKTEDLVGPYELHDFFLYHMLRNGYNPAKIYYIAQQSFEGKFDNATIKKWLTTFCRRFFAQQFKRSCMPDGPKVGSCSLSPRGDWKMPTDACSTLWLKECETL